MWNYSSKLTIFFVREIRIAIIVMIAAVIWMSYLYHKIHVTHFKNQKDFNRVIAKFLPLFEQTFHQLEATGNWSLYMYSMTSTHADVFPAFRPQELSYATTCFCHHTAPVCTGTTRHGTTLLSRDLRSCIHFPQKKCLISLSLSSLSLFITVTTVQYRRKWLALHIHIRTVSFCPVVQL